MLSLTESCSALLRVDQQVLLSILLSFAQYFAQLCSALLSFAQLCSALLSFA